MGAGNDGGMSQADSDCELYSDHATNVPGGDVRDEMIQCVGGWWGVGKVGEGVGV